ncbi:formylglycine-generating enzyme family protein [uncultured Pseudoteredinibacter sp.]|uniref:formylglycine-generating enzyme family protein n=1 Tax=uncultured Pseudoteredinibacter sp. TaxID=1641701 RepID=UPI00263329E0|nr:formylglycine-generating enzyme family protein [uncultured Pseudoteredinibacter sp.]
MLSSFLLCISLFGNDHSLLSKTIKGRPDNLSKVSGHKSISLIQVPGDDNIDNFYMSETEISNSQYLEFLNSAISTNDIYYSEADEMVYTHSGEQMLNLGGHRVIKDHDGDGIFTLDEMENPLNRSYISFNADTNRFQIVDPKTVDWNQYFDKSVYPDVVDTINDWAELNSEKSGFVGNGDQDLELPTIEEIKEWPVTHIRYFGAKAFADYYGYELPTMAQWFYAGKGGQEFEYATSDGNISESSAWYNTEAVNPPFPIHKGHAQPVRSLNPNPYGLYNLGGNVWEWVQDWHNPQDDTYFLDSNISDLRIDTNSPLSQDNQLKKGLLGGSFNYFPRIMATDWKHSAYVNAGNDHFGFRIVLNK